MTKETLLAVLRRHPFVEEFLPEHIEMLTSIACSTINVVTPTTTTETSPGYDRPNTKYPSNVFVTVHIASLLIRIVDTKNMCPHMNSASSRPDALCSQSRRAGQRLFAPASASPTPAMTSVVEFIRVSRNRQRRPRARDRRWAPLCFAAPRAR